MKLQGAGAAKFARKPDPAFPFVLIFGDDEGVVADTADSVIGAWQKANPAHISNLDEDAVKREPGLLFDALEAVSLLGDASIIRVRTKGEKLFSILKDVLTLAPERVAAKLVVQNGSLNTRSKLRTAFEQSLNGAALHVFADTSADIAERVRSRLGADGIAIEDAALSQFIGGLPGHRSLANAEIDKLALYGLGLETALSVADISALCETNADENARTAIHLALSGETDRAQAEFDRVIDAGLNPISLVRMFELEATRMLAAHALQQESGAQNVGMKLKPPVWKSDWPAFQLRLSKWPSARLLRLVERLHDLEFTAKGPKGAGVSAPGVRQLFVSCYTAAAAAKRPG